MDGFQNTLELSAYSVSGPERAQPSLAVHISKGLSDLLKFTNRRCHVSNVSPFCLFRRYLPQCIRKHGKNGWLCVFWLLGNW